MRSALIVGGGIAGLSAGIALKKAGFLVEVVEQAASIEPLGTALSLWGNAMAGLDWMGCGDAVRARANPIRTVSLSNRDDRILFGPVNVEATDSYLVMRSDLQAVLLEALGPEHCRLDTRLTRGDIERADADLLVIADGIRSELGQAICRNGIYASGYAGVLGVSAPMDQPIAIGLGMEIWGDAERFGLFDAGAGRTYWFFMKNLREGALESNDADDILEASKGWPPAVMRAVAATSTENLHTLPIMARHRPKCLGKGRMICVGDAAHALEPNQGQGACQAIEDAWALGVLAGRLEPDEILVAFERYRMPRLRAVIRDSALVGRAIHSPRRWERTVAQSLFAMIPAQMDRSQLLKRLMAPRYT